MSVPWQGCAEGLVNAGVEMHSSAYRESNCQQNKVVSFYISNFTSAGYTEEVYLTSQVAGAAITPGVTGKPSHQPDVEPDPPDGVTCRSGPTSCFPPGMGGC